LTALRRRRLKTGRPSRKFDRDVDALVAHVAGHPGMTLAELVTLEALGIAP
jgi:hypothetical protein